MLRDSINGAGQPTWFARLRNIRAARTPSATMCISAKPSSKVLPSPSFCPSVLLRLRGEVLVTYKSPKPAGPSDVSSLAPSKINNFLPSAKPIGTNAAFRLSPPMPSRNPSTIPQARAIVFLKAPHNSAPTGSSAALRTRESVDNLLATLSATERS